MLATRVMLERNCPKIVKFKGVDTNQYTLSDRGLPVRLRTKDQHEAIEAARDILRKSKMRMYDSRAGFKTLSKLSSLLQRDITLEHSQRRDDHASILVVDYIQKIRTGQSKKSWNESDLEMSCDIIGNIAQANLMTAFILSQPKRGSNARDEDAVDIDIQDKGGDALLELCDFQWTLQYKKQEEADEHEMKLILLESRRAGTGEVTYQINPSSGLITNPFEGTYKPVEGY